MKFIFRPRAQEDAHRAIRLYEQVGFTPLNTFLQRTNGGEYEFLRMVRAK